MKVERYIISLAKVQESIRVETLSHKVIKQLEMHQASGATTPAELTVYCSRENQYNDKYDGEVLSDEYKKQVEEQIRSVIRSFEIKDETYIVDVKYHGSSAY